MGVNILSVWAPASFFIITPRAVIHRARGDAVCDHPRSGTEAAGRLYIILNAACGGEHQSADTCVWLLHSCCICLSEHFPDFTSAHHTDPFLVLLSSSHCLYFILSYGVIEKYLLQMSPGRLRCIIIIKLACGNFCRRVIIIHLLLHPHANNSIPHYTRQWHKLHANFRLGENQRTCVMKSNGQMLVITSAAVAARWYLSAAACAKINWLPRSPASKQTREKRVVSRSFEKERFASWQVEIIIACVCVIIAQRWMRIGSRRDEEIERAQEKLQDWAKILIFHYTYIFNKIIFWPNIGFLI